METLKIDRLSSLAPELLDYIFELAASTHELGAVPPSKRFLSSHTRAYFRHLRIENGTQLEQFVANIEANPNKALSVKQISWSSYIMSYHLTALRLSRILERLLNLVAMEFGIDASHIARWISRNALLKNSVTSLRICRFPQQALSSDFVEWLAKNPNLRKVEVGLTHDSGAEDSTLISKAVPQVKELVFTTRNIVRPDEIHYPSQLHQIFPSAQLVALDLEIPNVYGLHLAMVDSLGVFLRQVNPTISSLRISHRSGSLSTRQVHLDHLLPRFPHLLHLLLDDAFRSEEFHTHLRGLKDLTSLTLSFNRSTLKYSEIDDLVSTFRQLPNLRTITFDYSPLRAGPTFDMELVETEVIESNLDPEEEDSIPGLEVADTLEQLTGWELPFPAQNLKESIDKAMKAEKHIKELGIEVRSNINKVIQILHRTIIEFYNRALGETYFFRYVDNLNAAVFLAEEFNLELPPLEIDSDNVGRDGWDKLEWDTVDMTEAVGGGGKKCIAYILRDPNR